MTQRVRITNLGPDDINVNECKAISPAADPTTQTGHTICPGESVEANVHSWRRTIWIGETQGYEDGHTHRQPPDDERIKHMVQRFLGWKLPPDFNPDAGISYTRPNYAPSVDATPSGTNLFSATQAEAMVRYMVDGLP